MVIIFFRFFHTNNHVYIRVLTTPVAGSLVLTHTHPPHTPADHGHLVHVIFLVSLCRLTFSSLRQPPASSESFPCRSRFTQSQALSSGSLHNDACNYY
jgi:hypothetical protein